MTIRVLLTIVLPVIAAAAGTVAQGVRPGFYIVGSFSGSSMGDDAAIWKARIQGTGAVYVPGFNPALELVVRQEPSPAAPVIAYVGAVQQADGLHSVHAANEPNLIGELEPVSHEEYGLVADLVQRGWARAVYGYTRTGQVRRGWVYLMPGRGEYKSVRRADPRTHHVVRGAGQGRTVRSPERTADSVPSQARGGCREQLPA